MVRYKDGRLGVVKDSQVVEKLANSWMVKTSKNKAGATFMASPITNEDFKTQAEANNFIRLYTKENANLPRKLDIFLVESSVIQLFCNEFSTTITFPILCMESACTSI